MRGAERVQHLGRVLRRRADAGGGDDDEVAARDGVEAVRRGDRDPGRSTGAQGHARPLARRRGSRSAARRRRSGPGRTPRPRRRTRRRRRARRGPRSRSTGARGAAYGRNLGRPPAACQDAGPAHPRRTRSVRSRGWRRSSRARRRAGRRLTMVVTPSAVRTRERVRSSALIRRSQVAPATSLEPSARPARVLSATRSRASRSPCDQLDEGVVGVQEAELPQVAGRGLAVEVRLALRHPGDPGGPPVLRHRRGAPAPGRAPGPGPAPAPAPSRRS